MHLSEIWHSKKNDCRLSRTQVNIDFHNTNFRLMGDYENFDAVTIAVGHGGVSNLK